MSKALLITTTARAGRKTPKGRVRPARRTTVAVVHTVEGWKSACITRYGRSTGEELAPVQSRAKAIRAAQHEAGAFVPEREWRGLKTTRFLAGGDNGGLKWRLHQALNGSYLVWGSAPCGQDGMYHLEYGVRGRRAAVRALQHAIQRGEVTSGAYASREDEDY